MCTVQGHVDQLDLEYLSLDVEHLEHLVVGTELLLTRAQSTGNARKVNQEGGQAWNVMSKFYWWSCISPWITVTRACCGLIDHVPIGS